jgi:hypothetical protein
MSEIKKGMSGINLFIGETLSFFKNNTKGNANIGGNKYQKL